MDVAQKELLYAYTAGLVDGEGTITIVYHKPDKKRKIAACYGVHISIANTDVRAFLKIQEVFGGSIYTVVDRRGYRTVYSWDLSRKNTKKFLTAIMPYLVIKKAQAELVMKFLKAFPKRARGQKLPDDVVDDRRAYYEEMRKLNHTLK